MMHHFYGPGGNYFMQGNFGWMGITSMIIHLLFWAVVIYFAIKLVNKYVKNVDESKIKENSAMSILRERFAKGEIDSEEFKQKKIELE